MNRVIPVSAKLRVLRSVFDLSDLRNWIATSWGIDVVRVRLMSYGINDHYTITTVNGDVFVLRIYAHGLRSQDEIDAECEFSIHLQQNGVSVAVPLLSTNGAYVQSIDAPEGTRSAILFSYAAGRPAAATDSAIYGSAVALLHNAADSYHDARRKSLDVEFWLQRPLRVLDDVLSNRPSDQAMVSEFGRELAARLDALDLDTFEWGYCHGDLHGRNAHIVGSTITFFDLDFCGPTWRAFELAIYCWGMSLRGHDDGARQDFLKAYTSLRQVATKELDAIDTFIWVRHLWWIALQREIEAIGSATTMSDEFLDKAMFVTSRAIAIAGARGIETCCSYESGDGQNSSSPPVIQEPLAVCRYRIYAMP